MHTSCQTLKLLSVLFLFGPAGLLLHLDAAQPRIQEPPTSSAYPPDMPGSRVEVYRTIGKVRLRTWIFEPEGKAAGEKRPAVVFFFGGGWTHGTPGQFLPQCHTLTSHGLVTFSMDYRVKERHGVTPRDCMEDAKAAIRWVRANADRLGVDPDRIVAAGGSAGGHLAAGTGMLPGLEEGAHLDVSSVPNAMILFNPALILAPTPDIPRQLPDGAVAALNARLGGNAEAISPYHHIRPDLPPCLILSGTADGKVPFQTVVQFQKKMAEAGNRCVLKGYPGQEHGFFNPGKGKGKERFQSWQTFRKTMMDVGEFLSSLGYLPVSGGGK